MNRSFILTFLMFSGLSLFAQTADSVICGPQNANDVYYNLSTGVVKTEPNTNWDLGFEIAGFTASILVNHVKGITVYQTPFPSSKWSTVDTLTKSSWKIMYNSQYKWTLGAFNLHTDGNFDLGWGVYDPGSHIIAGDSIYLLRFADGSFKKITFINLNSGIYNFKYADLDGSNEKTASVSKADYKNKNFIYYSFNGSTIIDREPPTASWDLVFTKYIDFIPTPYAVSGVWINKKVQSAEARGVSTTITDYSKYNFSDTTSTIGYDWKMYNGSTNRYEVETDRVYFVKTAGGVTWKLVFTGYKGGNSGTYYFNKQALMASAETPITGISGIFPNPTTGLISFSGNGIQDNATWTVHDLNGRDLLSGQGKTADLSSLKPGIYSLVVNSGVQTNRFKVFLKP